MMSKEEKKEMLKKTARVMSKDEEKLLLAKVASLLENADPDGYVAAAFRGCVDLARSNIENDFCISFEENLRLTEEDASRNYMKLCEAYEKFTDEKAELMESLQERDIEIERLDNLIDAERRDHAVNISRLQQQYSDACAGLEELKRVKTERDEKALIVEEQAKTIEDLNLEIMKMKAKIYDLTI